MLVIDDNKFWIQYHRNTGVTAADSYVFIGKTSFPFHLYVLREIPVGPVPVERQKNQQRQGNDHSGDLNHVFKLFHLFEVAVNDGANLH